MAYAREKLSALTVGRLAKTPGLYCDGGGLSLRVTSKTACSWVFRYMLARKAREMGLGKYPDVSLAEARIRAAEARRLKSEGLDPIEHRKEIRLNKLADEAKAVTFSQAAKRFIESNRAGWRNEKHAGQWEATLKTYAEPKLGRIAVQQIDTGLVLSVLEPIWNEKPETASRLRGRIEAVLSWAMARGYRTGNENPASWRGHLDKILPSRAKVRRVKHHSAMQFEQLPAFMQKLRQERSPSARALEFTILTAARTGEVLGAKWSEFDLTAKIWIVPGERMKAGREHRVPLSTRALAILNEVTENRCDDHFVFFSEKPDLPLSDMALLMRLRRMKQNDITTHGFRSTFRDWVSEKTNFPSELAEMALAHTIGNKVEAAYRRGDMFEKRRLLMDAWSTACGEH